jgi:hypothetical protein
MELVLVSISRGMDKENVAYIHSEVLLSHKGERNCVVCRKTDGNGDHC